MVEGDGGQVDWLDDLVNVIREVHDRIIRESGGVLGEHTALLYGAAARPFHSALGEFVYRSPTERAAALFHAIICDHAFVDGNKRTATVVAISFLSVGGEYLSLEGPPSLVQISLLGGVALLTASGDLTVEQVASWMRRLFI